MPQSRFVHLIAQSLLIAVVVLMVCATAGWAADHIHFPWGVIAVVASILIVAWGER